jgi:hypothetical protein
MDKDWPDDMIEPPITGVERKYGYINSLRKAEKFFSGASWYIKKGLEKGGYKVKTHIDASGRAIPIPLMSDDHLWNTIRLICRQIKEARSIVDREEIINKLPRSQMILSGIEDEEEQREIAEDILVQKIELLGNYVVEATIRGLEIRELVVNAVGREEGMHKERKRIAGNIDNLEIEDIEDKPK